MLRIVAWLSVCAALLALTGCGGEPAGAHEPVFDTACIDRAFGRAGEWYGNPSGYRVDRLRPDLRSELVPVSAAPMRPADPPVDYACRWCFYPLPGGQVRLQGRVYAYAENAARLRDLTLDLGWDLTLFDGAYHHHGFFDQTRPESVAVMVIAFEAGGVPADLAAQAARLDRAIVAQIGPDPRTLVPPPPPHEPYWKVLPLLPGDEGDREVDFTPQDLPSVFGAAARFDGKKYNLTATIAAPDGWHWRDGQRAQYFGSVAFRGSRAACDVMGQWDLPQDHLQTVLAALRAQGFDIVRIRLPNVSLVDDPVRRHVDFCGRGALKDRGPALAAAWQVAADALAAEPDRAPSP